MKPDLLKVLILLYQNYVRQTNQIIPDFESWFQTVSREQLTSEDAQTLSLTNSAEEEFLPFEGIPASTTLRIYSAEEQKVISPLCQGYLLSLEQQGMITPQIREKIIHRAFTLNKKVQLEELKWFIYELIAIKQNYDLKSDYTNDFPGFGFVLH